MVKARYIGAAMFVFLGGTVAQGSDVTPQDVKFDDGTVASSLTGTSGNPTAGRKHFANRKLGNCLACHTSKDMSEHQFHGGVGPSLDSAAERWTPEQLRAIVVNSKAVFGKETVMPAFYSLDVGKNVRKNLIGKTILTAAQVEDIVAYLLTLK